MYLTFSVYEGGELHIGVFLMCLAIIFWFGAVLISELWGKRNQFV